MKFLVLIPCLILSGIIHSQTSEEAIKSVFNNLSDAWQQADGEAWGAQFAEDADFTVWFGLHLKGRKAIAEGHQWVFDAVYPGTRYDFTISGLRFPHPDIAIVHLNASIIAPDGDLPEEPHTLPVAVLQKFGQDWKVIMFHNMNNRMKEIEALRQNGDMGDVRNH